MNTKFEVKFKIDFPLDSNVCTYLRVLDVIPQPICLNCPHCQVYSVMNVDSTVKRFEKDQRNDISFRGKILLFDFICSCPQCKNTIFIQAQVYGHAVDSDTKMTDEPLEVLSSGNILSVYPYPISITVPPEVPAKYAGDFRQAVLIVNLSPAASAALSRRILQNILRDEFAISRGNLYEEIKAFVAQPGIPSYLTDDIDAIRKIGNFAAHPLKDTNTGEIMPVEPGEAGWLIEVLNSLFDFRFIQPLKSQERRDKLNAKIQDLGKPPRK